MKVWRPGECSCAFSMADDWRTVASVIHACARHAHLNVSLIGAACLAESRVVSALSLLTNGEYVEVDWSKRQARAALPADAHETIAAWIDALDVPDAEKADVNALLAQILDGSS